MRKFLVSAVAAVALLGACTTGTEGQSVDEAPVGVNRPVETVDEAPVEMPTLEETPTPEDTSEAPTFFGGTYTWMNGLSVTVSTPKAFKPGAYAFGAEPHKNNIVFTVTIINKTTKVYDPTLFFLTMQSGNEEASAVFDSEAKITGSPSTNLLPGREARFKAAFNVLTPKDLVLEVNPGFEYRVAYFATK